MRILVVSYSTLCSAKLMSQAEKLLLNVVDTMMPTYTALEMILYTLYYSCSGFGSDGARQPAIRNELLLVMSILLSPVFA